jgi:hypothetical protein
MSPRRVDSARSTTDSALRLNLRLLDVLHQLPGDRLKMTLRLVKRARWVPSSTEQGAPLELQFHLRVEELWEAILLDRDAVGDVAGFRQVLHQLEKDPSLTQGALEGRGD